MGTCRGALQCTKIEIEKEKDTCINTQAMEGASTLYMYSMWLKSNIHMTAP